LLVISPSCRGATPQEPPEPWQQLLAEIRAVEVIYEQPEVVYGDRALLDSVGNPRSDLHAGGCTLPHPGARQRALAATSGAGPALSV